MNPTALLTPKDLADAIGVSESSLRRWVDGGNIGMSRTAGGHRRIPLPEAIQFIRRIGATVVRPDVLGLGDLTDQVTGAAQLHADDRLFQKLHAGAADAARTLILSWYLQGKSLAMLFDGPVRDAMYRIGQLWQHDERGVLIEHRATEICIEAVAIMQSLLPPIADSAPLALGGAPQGDPYQLPTMMAAAVLAEAGYRAVNFGPETPVDLLAAEAIDRGARLVWLSVSAAPDPKALRVSLARAADALAEHRIDLILGGRHQMESAPKDRSNVSQAASMGELAAFARGVRSSARSKS